MTSPGWLPGQRHHQHHWELARSERSPAPDLQNQKLRVFPCSPCCHGLAGDCEDVGEAPRRCAVVTVSAEPCEGCRPQGCWGSPGMERFHPGVRSQLWLLVLPAGLAVQVNEAGRAGCSDLCSHTVTLYFRPSMWAPIWAYFHFHPVVLLKHLLKKRAVCLCVHPGLRFGLMGFSRRFCVCCLMSRICWHP